MQVAVQGEGRCKSAGFPCSSCFGDGVTFLAFTKMVKYLLLVVALLFVYVNGKQPHILFIVADDFGWNDIGYHGSEIPTPNLDALAGEGVKLNNYYIQLVCTPSRASIMTGRYPIRYGLQHAVLFPQEPAGLNLSETTLADVLRHAGYQTHAVGKWHLGFFAWDYTPLYRGFDTYYGYYNGAENYFTHNQSQGGMDGYDFRNNAVDKSVIGEYSTTAYTKYVEGLVANYTASNSTQPLFVYMAFQACHDPLQLPMEHQSDNCTNIKDRPRMTFCEMAVALDRGIANITRAFQAAGLWQDTIMVFTADNGGLPNPPGSGNNYPLRGGKFTLFEGGIRGTAFVTSPLLPNKGTTSDQMMHLVDWLPTLASVAEADVNVPGKPVLPLDGYNMWDSISQNTASPRNTILHNIDELSNTSAIRVGDWKLIQGAQPYSGWIAPPSLESSGPYNLGADNETIYLFNITADPTEHNNLADSHPDVVAKLQSLLTICKYAKQMAPAWWVAGDPNSDPTKHDGTWNPWIEL